MTAPTPPSRNSTPPASPTTATRQRDRAIPSPAQQGLSPSPSDPAIANGGATANAAPRPATTTPAATGRRPAGLSDQLPDGDPHARPDASDPDGASLQRAVDRQDRGVPGHKVVDRQAIMRALSLSGFNGSFDTLSAGEEQRVRALLRYQQMDLSRPHLVGSPAMLARLDKFDAAQPNFAAMTRLVRRAVSLSFISGSALTAPPTVLVGAPGIGKTRYAKGLAAALGTSFDTVNGASLPDVASLTGYPPVWRGAGPGRIAKFLVGSPTSSPLIFIDECEKVADADRTLHPLDRLLALLERDTAAAYEDECLQVPMRAQHAILIFGCNSLENLSGPFRDRVVTIPIPGLTAAEREVVLAAMLDEVAGEIGLRVTLGRPDALDPLRALSLRRCRIALRLAVAQAVENQRRFLLARDLADAVALLGPADTRRSAGFVRFGADERDPA